MLSFGTRIPEAHAQTSSIGKELPIRSIRHKNIRIRNPNARSPAQSTSSSLKKPVKARQLGSPTFVGQIQSRDLPKNRTRPSTPFSRVSLRPSTSFQESRTSPEISPGQPRRSPSVSVSLRGRRKREIPNSNCRSTAIKHL
jgi:hypothetical protein